MSISLQEKMRRKKGVDFVRDNSRLEGLACDIPEINKLYDDYVEGYIDLEELCTKTRIIANTLLVDVVAG